MSILTKFFRKGQDRAHLQPLYNAVVTAARRPEWYLNGKVADTLDGRFDMVAMMLSLVLLRLETDKDRYAAESALLTEIFVDDMDGQLREIGIGDVVVGKHLGRMMSALGGRLGAYREALADGADLEAALERNLYRGEKPDPAALAWTAARLRVEHAAIMDMPVSALIDGQWPER
ncbi:MAG: ubiquinol-cytochrome C chaperone family protein [Sphingomonadaceae bacterium]